MKQNKKALSLVVAMWLTLVMALVAVYLLDYMFPFMKNTKWIERSVWAYYQADSAIEDALYSMKFHSSQLDYEKHKDFTPWKRIDYKIDMTSSWYTLPPLEQWNSDFNKDFNIIKIWEPIQFEIWHGTIDLDNFNLYFQVPDTNNDNTNSEKLLVKDKNGNDIKYISWQISSRLNSLNAEDSQLTSNQINWSMISNLKDFNGRDLNDQIITVQNFYNNYCAWTNSGCILKMSVINKLKLTNNEDIPYLEWKIESWTKIPLRYRIIETAWRDFWFQKFLKVRIPQRTSNQAFDFTVFQ